MAVKNEFNEVNSLQILVLRENCDWLQGTFLKKSKHILVIQQNRKNIYKYYLLINICTIFNYNLCFFLWLHKIYMHHKIKTMLNSHFNTINTDESTWIHSLLLINFDISIRILVCEATCDSHWDTWVIFFSHKSSQSLKVIPRLFFILQAQINSPSILHSS